MYCIITKRQPLLMLRLLIVAHMLVMATLAFTSTTNVISKSISYTNNYSSKNELPSTLTFSTRTIATTISTTHTIMLQMTNTKDDTKVANPVHDDNDDDYVARRIIVTGDVQGGYVRACILNEAGRFRRLVGTMSPPDESNTSEIYVEGKLKMVEGFIRWCQRSKIGLNQSIKVQEVIEEEVTGLYDEFYVRTK